MIDIFKHKKDDKHFSWRLVDKKNNTIIRVCTHLQLTTEHLALTNAFKYCMLLCDDNIINRYELVKLPDKSGGFMPRWSWRINDDSGLVLFLPEMNFSSARAAGKNIDRARYYASKLKENIKVITTMYDKDKDEPVETTSNTVDNGSKWWITYPGILGDDPKDSVFVPFNQTEDDTHKSIHDMWRYNRSTCGNN